MKQWPNVKVIDKAEAWLISKRSYGFLDGGCLIFAEAIKLIIPNSSVVTILRAHHPDHYGVKIEDKYWGDARGIHTCRYIWGQRFSVEERIFGRIEVTDRFIPSKEVPRDPELSQQIARMLEKRGA